MRVTAVMQPYLFPYIGYFQLVAAADEFIFYDDVQYINEGWINRNRLPGGWFTVPVAAASLSTPIRERQVATLPYARFRRKWLKRFAQSYGAAPYYSAVHNLVQAALPPDPTFISQMAERSVRDTAAYLGLTPAFARSGELTYDRDRPRQEKLLSLLSARNAEIYVNPVGGRDLYQAEDFARHNISLRFLTSQLDYTEEEPGHGYSILHLLAHHAPEDCRHWLSRYTITTPHTHESPDLHPAAGRPFR